MRNTLRFTLGIWDTVSNQRGGTIILFLLILVLASATLLMDRNFSQSVQLRRQRETLTMLAHAREALLGFAYLHGRLPRPAVSSVDGRESAIPCTDDASCTGYLPWVTLGLSKFDSWGVPLRYSAAVDFTSPKVDFSTAVATKTVATKVEGRLVFVAGGTECMRDRQCIPAIILSSGRLGVLDYSRSSHFPSHLSTMSLDNSFATRAFFRTSAVNDPRADPADGDMLVWVPLLPLINRITSGSP